MRHININSIHSIPSESFETQIEIELDPKEIALRIAENFDEKPFREQAFEATKTSFKKGFLKFCSWVDSWALGKREP